ncbi:MAG: hypothetical protein KJZ65_05555 [Phycisphaerales bacterium]|nr:hypothetical protein [Phycisphaerales bacterium]
MKVIRPPCSVVVLIEQSRFTCVTVRTVDSAVHVRFHMHTQMLIWAPTPTESSMEVPRGGCQGIQNLILPWASAVKLPQSVDQGPSVRQAHACPSGCHSP